MLGVYDLGRTNPPSFTLAATDEGTTRSDSPRTVMVQNIGKLEGQRQRERDSGEEGKQRMKWTPKMRQANGLHPSGETVKLGTGSHSLQNRRPVEPL